MSNPNPFSDFTPWGDFIIGGWTVPATLKSVDGVERAYEWAVQKGTGTSGATTVYRGEKVCEGATTVFEAHDLASFDGLYALRDRVIVPKGKRPPTLAVVNPIFNFCGVNRLALSVLGSPVPTPSLSYLLSVRWIEYRPSKPAAVGPQDPAKAPAVPTPNDAAEAALAAVLAKAATL